MAQIKAVDMIGQVRMQYDFLIDHPIEGRPHRPQKDAVQLQQERDDTLIRLQKHTKAIDNYDATADLVFAIRRAMHMRNPRALNIALDELRAALDRAE